MLDSGHRENAIGCDPVRLTDSYMTLLPREQPQIAKSFRYCSS
jgi:hypothetical protein